MILEVTNKNLSVGQIEITGVSSSSVVLVGDTKEILSVSYFDTPLESQMIGPVVPFAPVTLG